MERVRGALRTGHYSHLTEKAYVGWIKRYILFHGKRHPADLGAEEIGGFLTHLAVDRKVSAPTQNQALNALLFLYRKVLAIELPWIDGVVRAKQATRLPVVLSVEEVTTVLAQLDGVHSLIGHLLYGSGLRLLERLRLRVKDINFDARQIVVRRDKGSKDRVTALAPSPLDSIRSARRR